MKQKQTKISGKRLLILVSLFIFLFALLAIRLFWLQFIQGPWLKKQAYLQQTTSKIISPKRGAIYDSTGKALAISASVDTVSIKPNSVKYSNGDIVPNEILAYTFSNIFELDYEETLNTISANKKLVTVAKKVEQDKIDLLRAWMKDNKVYSGITIDADTKRYYPYNNLASNLIGFCGTDNQGLEGLEYGWDSVLAGTNGKSTSVTDSVNQEIPDSNVQYIPAENGSNLTLTIDLYIQSIAEKYLEQAVNSNNSSRGGNVLIMNPSTGDIMAMATYPSYNLNEPFTPNTKSLQEKWESLSSQEKSDAWYYMWRNRAISDGYEPGSTFKILNAAIALEENIVTADNSKDFICTGYEVVANQRLACWKSYDPHGYQSLRDALKNSCNPAFMQLAEKITSRTLYKYYDGFGLFDKTGITLPGEANSIFHNIDNVNATELATMGFGQRFTITPLQLVSAVSAIANDGILMKPRIVKEITNTDTGVVSTVEPTQVRQVISKETAEEMMSLLETVVTDGTGKLAAVKGYSIGGKTGTSEPQPGKEEEEGRTVSYLAVSPTVDAELVILVTLYGCPDLSSYQGGSVVAPVVKQILTEVLPYLGIPSDSATSVTTANNSLITLPDVRNKTIANAEKALKNAGFRIQFSNTSDNNSVLVTDQVPKPGVSLTKDSLICLYSSENNARTSVVVPNLKNMTLAQAINSVRAKNLNISYEGTGVVVTQDIAFDTSVEEGTIIHIVLEKQLNGGY